MAIPVANPATKWWCQHWSLLLVALVGDSFRRAVANPPVAGACAILGYKADRADEVQVLLVESIPANMEIFLTDRGVYPDGQISNHYHESEVVLVYNFAQETPAGIVLTLDNFTTPSGRAPADFLSTAGDQVIIFRGSIDTPNFLCALGSGRESTWQSHADDVYSSALPPGLTAGRTAIVIDADAEYDRSLTTGTREELLAAINDPALWRAVTRSASLTPPVEYTLLSQERSVTTSAQAAEVPLLSTASLLKTASTRPRTNRASTTASTTTSTLPTIAPTAPTTTNVLTAMTSTRMPVITMTSSRSSTLGNSTSAYPIWMSTEVESTRASQGSADVGHSSQARSVQASTAMPTTSHRPTMVVPSGPDAANQVVDIYLSGYASSKSQFAGQTTYDSSQGDHVTVAPLPLTRKALLDRSINVTIGGGGYVQIPFELAVAESNSLRVFFGAVLSQETIASYGQTFEAAQAALILALASVSPQRHIEYVEKLVEPITFLIPFERLPQGGLEFWACEYWDEEKGAFSSDGVLTLRLDQEGLLCRTSHLSIFAAIKVSSATYALSCTSTLNLSAPTFGKLLHVDLLWSIPGVMLCILVLVHLLLIGSACRSRDCKEPDGPQGVVFDSSERRPRTCSQDWFMHKVAQVLHANSTMGEAKHLDRCTKALRWFCSFCGVTFPWLYMNRWRRFAPTSMITGLWMGRWLGTMAGCCASNLLVIMIAPGDSCNTSGEALQRRDIVVATVAALLFCRVPFFLGWLLLPNGPVYVEVEAAAEVRNAVARTYRIRRYALWTWLVVWVMLCVLSIMCYSTLEGPTGTTLLTAIVFFVCLDMLITPILLAAVLTCTLFVLNVEARLVSWTASKMPSRPITWTITLKSLEFKIRGVEIELFSEGELSTIRSSLLHACHRILGKEAFEGSYLSISRDEELTQLVKIEGAELWRLASPLPPELEPELGASMRGLDFIEKWSEGRFVFVEDVMLNELFTQEVPEQAAQTDPVTVVRWPTREDFTMEPQGEGDATSSLPVQDRRFAHKFKLEPENTVNAITTSHGTTTLHCLRYADYVTRAADCSQGTAQCDSPFGDHR